MLSLSNVPLILISIQLNYCNNTARYQRANNPKGLKSSSYCLVPHPSIHPFICYSYWVTAAYPKRLWALKGTPGDASLLQDTNSHTIHTKPISLQHMSLRWEEAGGPRGNPWGTETPHAHGGGRNQTPQPWKCETSVQANVTPLHSAAFWS